MSSLAEQLLSIFKANGFDVSLDQVEILLEENGAELTEEELDAISGGGGASMTEEGFRAYLKKLGLSSIPFSKC